MITTRSGVPDSLMQCVQLEMRILSLELRIFAETGRIALESSRAAFQRAIARHRAVKTPHGDSAQRWRKVRRHAADSGGEACPQGLRIIFSAYSDE